MPLEGQAGEAGAGGPGGSASADASPDPVGAEAGRALRAARGQAQPSDERRRRRESAHLPFRSGCAHCVRGRMPNAPRASVLPGTHTVPEVAMDYCFLTKDGSDTSLTVL
eukprot:8169308-Alexandrium_andersonii.AAC.1